MKDYLLILLFLFGTTSGYAKDDNTIDILSEVSNGLFYNYDEAKSTLDSLRDVFSDHEVADYQHYFSYCDAFCYFLEHKYEDAFVLSNGALFSFINSKDKEWEARCLLLIAFIAEKNRLTDEALEAYSEAVLAAESNQILGLAYLGLARCQKRKGGDWSHSYMSGVDYLKLTKSCELGLYHKQVVFWFYPDSSSLPEVSEGIGESYEDLGYYEKAAASYKLISSYYLKLNCNSLADSFINRSLNQLKRKEQYSQVSLSSSLFVKARVQLAMGDSMKAYENFRRSTRIYTSIGQEQQNYHIYSYLIGLDTVKGNFQNALYYSNMSLKSYRSMSALKTKWAREITIVLADRQVLIKALLAYKKSTTRGVVCFFVLFLMISIAVIIRVILRRRAAEESLLAVKALMKDSIMEVKKKRFSKYVENTSTELEMQVNKHLSGNKDLLENIKKDSVDMILLIERHMPLLSDREKKCASLIAMGCANKDIAELLSIKADSVKTYRGRIRKKLNMENSKSDLRKEILRILKID